jgi:hypothetical protein
VSRTPTETEWVREEAFHPRDAIRGAFTLRILESDGPGTPVIQTGGVSITLGIDAYITINLNLACKAYVRILFEVIA